MDNLATVDTTQTEQPTATIDTGVAPPVPPSDDVAVTRSYKAHMGLGDIINQTHDQIYKTIADGKEDAFRKEASDTILSKSLELRQQRIKELAAQKGSNLTLQDINSLDVPPKIDPKAVIEKTYARAYVNTVKDAAARLEDTILTDAQAKNPEAVEAYFNAGSDVLSRREYALKSEQNLQSAVDQDAWFNIPLPEAVGGGMNVGSKASPFRAPLNILTFGAYGSLKEEVNLRGNTDKVSRFFSPGLGETLSAQAEDLLNTPSFTDFQHKFDDIIDDLKKNDPSLAQRFAHYIGGVTSNEKYFDDLNSLMNITIAGNIAKGVRGSVKGYGERQVQELGRRTDADGVYRAKVNTPKGSTEVTIVGPNAEQQVQKAVSDVVKSANIPEVTKATIAEGAGDNKEAGVQKAITSVIIRPDPKQDAQDTLLSLYKSNKQDLENNPGNLSREEHTRLINAAESFEKNAVNALFETSRPERLPVDAEEGFRGIADRVKDQFRGRENTIADVVYRHEPASNTHHFDVKIVNYDGQNFSSVEGALRHAEINGYGNPIIEGTANERVYIPAVAAKNLESVKTTPTETKFYIDKGVEVEASANPSIGHIPYNLRTGKFEPAVTEDTYRVAQQGLGFYIIKPIALNETQTFIRDGLIRSSRAESTSNVNTSSSTSIANAVIGYIRSPNDTLAKTDIENRVKSVYGKSRFLKVIKDEMQYVEDLYKGLVTRDPVTGEKPSIVTHYPSSVVGSVTGKNKTIWEDFVRTLKASQKMDDPVTGLPGYYMKTPAEIQDFYQRTFERPASYAEQQAYLAVGRLDHFDHMIRSTAVYRNKARLGVQSHVFYTSKDGVRTASEPFDAQPLSKVRVTAGDVALIHSADGTETYWHKLNPKSQAEFRKLVEQGQFKGAQIYDPEKLPVYREDSRGNPLRIQYVFSNAFETSPITYDQIGYRGGGHWNFDYEHYVKQPTIRTQYVGNKLQHVYEGDTTFSPVSNHAMGEDFAKHMNTIQDLIFNKDTKAAKAYAKSVFDIEWKDLYAGFRPSKNPVTGRVEQRFSTDPRQKFAVVSRGNTIFDINKDLEKAYERVHPVTGDRVSTFVDGTRHGSLARNFQVEYTGTRDSYDLFEPQNAGSVANPFYKFQPANFTDPITTLTRSLERIVNSIYMDDMKIFSAEHWLQENMHLLEGSEAMIRSSPFWYFNKGEFKKDAPSLAVANAESNRYKAQQLIGTPSKIDTVIQGIKQELSDAAYERTGKVTKAPAVAAEWMLDRIHDPISFFRGMTFHKYLGLFNPVQLITQNMSYATIYSLASPRTAISGSFGALMHQWSRVNREHVDAMDKHATLFGWRPGEFKEAMQVLERTGFGNIAGELAIDNGMRKESYTRLAEAPMGLKGRLISSGRTFLDYGQTFFNAAERNVRFGAWYAAFSEFRQGYPTAKIGPVEEGKILARANDLYSNMSRDSNSMLNKGVLSVPLQFFAYQQKLGELFWSKRIGNRLSDGPLKLIEGEDGVFRPEKDPNTLGRRLAVRAKMFFIFSLLYGAVGATGLSLIPGGDIIRQKALEKGYVVGKDAWTYLMEGPTAVALHALTGTWYNLNNRYGANGYAVLRDLMRQDTTLWKILGGAAGTDIGNTLASFDGFTNAMYSMMVGKKGLEAYSLTIDDWVAPLKTISSFKYADRMVYALQFGKWLDSHGRPVGDVSKVEAVFRTLTGLQDVRQDDIYLMGLTKKDEDVRFKKALGEFEHWSRLADQAAANNDTEQANDYNKKAFFVLNYSGVPQEMYGKAIQRRATMNKDTIEKAQENYYRNFVPTYRQDSAREADRAIQQQKENK